MCNTDNEVTALLANGSNLIVAGKFTKINSTTANRASLAIVSQSTGAVQSFNANIGYNVILALAVNGNTLYVGNVATHNGIFSGNGVRAYNINTGSQLPYSPNAAGGATINTITCYNGKLYVGGAFALIGGEVRGCIAAIDLATNSVSPWSTSFNPSLSNDKYTCLATANNKLYAGGDFAVSSAAANSNLVCLDLNTGATVTSWAPATLPVNSIIIDSSFVYAGGIMSTSTYTYIKRIDTLSGSINSWAPSSSAPSFQGTVYQLLINNNRLLDLENYSTGTGADYIYGHHLPGGTAPFNAIGASYSSSTAYFYAMENLTPNRIVVGGLFSNLISASRTRLGLANTTGTTITNTPWSPNVPTTTHVISVASWGGKRIFAGLRYNTGNRYTLRVFDTTSNNPLYSSWNPSLTAGSTFGYTLPVKVIALGADTVIAFGAFGGVSGHPFSYIARFHLNRYPAVSISINTASTSVCAGSSVTFTASAGTGINYQWKVNNVNAGTNSATFTYTPTNGDQITCVATATASSYYSITTATSNTLTMTVNPTVTPSLSIATPATTVCAGTIVTFTPTPVNGGATPAYQWKVNGTNSGTGTTFSYTPANGDVVTCSLTSSASCPSPSVVSSNSITMSVTPTVTPSVTVAASSSVICAGANITFTATPTNGGSSPAYQWKVNSTNVGTGASYAYVPANGDTVSVMLSSSANCPAPASVNSAPFIVSTVPLVTPTISISSSANPVCAGTTVTFNSSVTNSGTTPSFLWKVNSTNVGSGNSYSYQPANSDTVVCVLTTSAYCATAPTATSNAIIMSVTPTVTPSVSISTASSTVCSGAVVNYTASPINGGTSPAYQWKVNGTNAGTNSASFLYTPVNGDTVRCVLTSNAACPTLASVSSSNIVMTVLPYVTPTVSISTASTTVCAGTSVTFTASPTNGGSTPSYQWKVNSANVGTGSTYTYSPSNGDTVRCVLTSGALCTTVATANSNNIIMSVTPTVTPSLSISSSTNNVCAGTSVSFSATPTNGGGSPGYQWKVNSANVGTNSSGYSYTPTNGDTVRCILTSSATCPSPASISSNAIVMLVNPVVTPAITVSTQPNDSICAGTAVTFTTSIIAGGTSPAYQWKLNGSNTGTNTSTYTSSSLVNGDIITCSLTSNAPCATATSASSPPVVMTVHRLPTPIITRSGSLLNAGAARKTYAWFLNGNPIAGAGGATYPPTQNGSYTVTVTDSNDCSGTSPAFTVAFVGVDDIHVSSEISWYPNPAQTTVTISAPFSVNVKVLAADGKVVLTQKGVKRLDVHALPDGVYTLQVLGSYDQILKIGKLVKLAK